MSVEEGITRRGFLKGAAAIYFGSRLKPPRFLSATPEVNPPDEVDQKIAEIQDKYGVNITTIYIYYSQHPDKNPPRGSIPTYEWDIDRLNLLNWFLQTLPPHFHQGAPNGDKLTIVLAERSGLNGDWIPEREARLDIGYDALDSENRRRSLLTYAHESIHWITPLKLTFMKNGKVFKESPWFDKIYQILGGSYAEPPTKLSAQLLDEAGYANIKIPKETDDQSFFLARFNYGINWDYPNELLGIMGEHYLLGEDYFSRMYGKYLDADQTYALYDFMKKNVFLGQEYNSFG